MLLAHDEGPRRGFGHRRRMDALSAALGARGVLVDRTTLDGGSIEAPSTFIDSYVIRADDTSRVSAGYVGAIDDLERDLAVDLLVDPAPDASRPSRAREALLGLEHALVDPLVTELTPSARPEVGSVIVTHGGAAGAAVEAIAAELARVMPGIEIVLAVPPGYGPVETPGVRAVQTTDGLCRELADADLVVTAAGVTMLEAMALGRPIVATVTSENQRRYADGIARRDGIVLASASSVVDDVIALTRDAGRHRDLGARARELVDGRGAFRVADVLADRVR